MKNILWMIYLISMLFCGVCRASVPHHVDRYGFSMQLPGGFTYLVEQENIGQHLYEDYMGCAESKSYVHVWIAKQIYDEDYVGERLKHQLDKTVDVYKKEGAEIVSTEIVKLHLTKGLSLTAGMMKKII